VNTVQINDAHLLVVQHGPPGALPVVFIHGFPFSHAMWQYQFGAVSRHFRAIAYDVRGLGGSSVGDGQYTIEGHVDDLIGLLDHLEIPKAVILGLSMGGYIALRALERNPERWIAAVLCNTRSEADTNEGRIGRAAAVRTVKKTGSQAFADEFVRKVFAPASFTRVPDAVEMITGIIARTPPLAIAGTLLALAGRTDTTGSLSDINVPTLIMVGEHDVTTPPEASRAMHGRIAASVLHIVPEAAHMSPMENPDFVNSHLLEFLNRLQ
jgi:pimeloyl-ACP methyl ester carboxylesterase